MHRPVARSFALLAGFWLSSVPSHTQCQVDKAEIDQGFDAEFGRRVDLDGLWALIASVGYIDPFYPSFPPPPRVMRREPTGWELDATLPFPTDGMGNPRLGYLGTGDIGFAPGEALVTFAPEDGVLREVLVYREIDPGWVLTQVLTNPVDDGPLGGPFDFDDDWLVVTGASGMYNQTTAVYVFERDQGPDWVYHSRLLPQDILPNQSFGSDIQLEGDLLVVGAARHTAGANESGAVYVYERSGSVWNQVDKLVPSGAAEFDRYGGLLALQGDDLLVGAGPFNSRELVVPYRKENGVWVELPKLATIQETRNSFGVHLQIEGDLALVGCEFGETPDFPHTPCGAVSVHRRVPTGWEETAWIHHADPDGGDGMGLAFELEGTRLLVGVPGQDGTGDDDSGPFSLGYNFGAIYEFLVDPAAVSVRSGSTPGPPEHTNVTPPVIGTDWETHVATSGGSLLVLFLGGPSPFPIATGFGELLCLPPVLALDPSAIGQHVIPIPPDCGLVGLELCTQALVPDSGGGTRLTNALDVRIGTY